MERLWTPWRLAYVTTSGRPTETCIFCDALARGDAEPLTVYRGRACFVILNKFPYNHGHLMVVCHRHVGRLADLTPDETAELMSLARLAEVALAEAFGPHGFNVGVNVGQPAGAGVLDHLHMHVVPRWSGDTNFMGVVAETRVLPEELSRTAERLRPVFARLAGPAA